MSHQDFPAIIGGDHEGGQPFMTGAYKIPEPADLEEIEKDFLKRFNRLADKSFTAVPFDEGMWDYLHALQEEIHDLYARLGTGKGLVPWNGRKRVENYCESIHAKLTKCEKQLRLP